MKLITRDTDYAVRALCYIAVNKETVVSAADLVKALKIPRPFLRKILQKLHKEGVLRAHKGQGGGFSMLRSPNNLYLTELMKIYQGSLSINQCTFVKKVCPHVNTCKLRKKIKSVEKTLISELKKISIASLVT